MALIDEYESTLIEEYKGKGALPKKDLLEKKIKEGLWTVEKEKKMTSLENNIRLMSQKKRKASIVSQIEDIEELIKDYEKEYIKLYQEKNSLINLSAESLASSATTEFIISLSFYNDEACKEKTFSLEDVIDFSTDELSEILVIYKDCSDLFKTDNIKKISVNSNVKIFVKAATNAESFFGRSGSKLTRNQVYLFDYCKYFSSLLDRIQDIDEEERQDPDEIERIFILEMNKDQIKPGESRAKLMEAFGKGQES